MRGNLAKRFGGEGARDAENRGHREEDVGEESEAGVFAGFSGGEGDELRENENRGGEEEEGFFFDSAGEENRAEESSCGGERGGCFEDQPGGGGECAGTGGGMIHRGGVGEIGFQRGAVGEEIDRDVRIGDAIDDDPGGDRRAGDDEMAARAGAPSRADGGHHGEHREDGDCGDEHAGGCAAECSGEDGIAH